MAVVDLEVSFFYSAALAVLCIAAEKISEGKSTMLFQAAILIQLKCGHENLLWYNVHDD